MRLRHPNPQQSPDQRVRALIAENDLLSNNEQEEVLDYFRRSLRSTLTLLRFVACFHGLLALVYLVLLISGSPLVYMVMDAEEAKLLEVLHAKQISVRPPSTTAPVDRQEDTNTLRSARAAQDRLKALETFTYLAETETMHQRYSSMLTPGSVVCMLASIIILIFAGWGSWKACRHLAVTPEMLEGHGSDGAPHSSPPTCTSVADVLRQMLRSPHQSQMLAGAVAVWPTLYWIYSLATYHHDVNKMHTAAGLPTAALWFGISDSFMELVLIVWQPLFHVLVGWMILSIGDTRRKLLKLSQLRYVFEKE